jgi:hypothetical protein
MCLVSWLGERCTIACTYNLMAEAVVGTHMHILTFRLPGFLMATAVDIELSRGELCNAMRLLAARVSAVPSGFVAQVEGRRRRPLVGGELACLERLG